MGWSRFFKRRYWDSERSREIESYIEIETDENIARGMSPDDARSAAVRKLGNATSVREDIYELNSVRLLETVRRDVNFAFRMLLRNRAWSAVAILSLALGIGTNSALFTAAKGVLLDKLPVRNPDELVAFHWSGQGGAFDYGYVAPDDSGPVRVSFSPRTFSRFQEANHTLSSLFAFAPGPTVSLVVDGQAEIATSQFVSGEYYGGLGVSAARGRVLIPDDDSAASDLAVAISHRYWERRFGKDPGIVGKKVSINSFAATIVGVEPPGLGVMWRIGNESQDVVMPVAMAARLGTHPIIPGGSWLMVMGRMKAGTTLPQVEANFESAFQPGTKDAAPGARVYFKVAGGSRGVHDAPKGTQTQFSILAAVFGVFLFIVCVNLANLSLFRTQTRRAEIEARIALGATHAMITRQLLTESLVLAAFGGAAGLAVARGCQSLLNLFLANLGLATSDGLDWSTFGSGLAIAVGTGIVFGIVPAFRVSLWNPTRGTLTGNRFTHRGSALGKVLVGFQIAMSLVLLVGSGLFLGTLRNLQKVDIGFNVDNLVLFTIDPQLARYETARATAVYDRIVERLSSLPGVRSASFSAGGHFSGNTNGTDIHLGSQAPPSGEQGAFDAVYLMVHADYFRTMEIPITQGRGFLAANDAASGTPVAIVSESFARRAFGESNPIGQKFIGARSEPLEIIGVVADTRYNSLREPAPPIYYEPHAQWPDLWGVRAFEVRTAGNGSIFPAIRAAVRDVDPRLPLLNPTTQLASVAEYRRFERAFAWASIAFGGMALIVSMIGLFGLLSYAVARDTKAIGIRMALGAEATRIRRSVLFESFLTVGIGIVVGLVAATATTRYIKAFLFGLSPVDPTTILSAIFLMFIVAGLASYFPARRASLVDPIVALRHD